MNHGIPHRIPLSNEGCSRNLNSLDKVFHRSLYTSRTYANNLMNLDDLCAYHISYRDRNRTHL